MPRKVYRNSGRVRVNNPPKYRRKMEFKGGPEGGRPNPVKPSVDPPSDGKGPKKPFDEAYARTKDLARKEGESDADYAARQEKYKTRRGKMARRTLRSTLGKNWGKRVYEGKWQSAQQRKSALESFNTLKDRESQISDKLSKAEDDARKAALQKRLDTVKANRKEAGADVREFRGERRAALKTAYETPKKAQKAYPKVREFSASLSGSRKPGGQSGTMRGSKTFQPGGKPEQIRGSISTGGTKPVTLPGGRPVVPRRKKVR